MRVQINRLKALDELYALRDQQRKEHELKMEQWKEDMVTYAAQALQVVELVAGDLKKMKDGYVYDGDDSETFEHGALGGSWNWSRSGIHVQVEYEFPSKPHGIDYRLERVIAMLERHSKDDIGIDENHDIVRFIVPK